MNYRWNSIGYYVQTDNKDDFLSHNFGLTEFGQMDEKERFRRYRNYLYEAGAIARKDEKKPKPVKGIDGLYSLKRLSS